MKPLMEAFGVTVQETALGIYRVANASMARALRRVTVERGVDARTCTLIAFGGAGPMHAVALAREFGISRVVVPKYSSVFSAFGCLTAELSYAEQHTIHMSNTAWDAERIENLRRNMYERLSQPLAATGCAPEKQCVRNVALIRYAGQSGTVEVPFESPPDPVVLGADFKARHERLYGFATDEAWELDTLRLTLSAPTGKGAAAMVEAIGDASTIPISTASCWFGTSGPVPTPRYARGSLPKGWDISGPAIIEDEWSTIVVPPGAVARADDRGHIQIDVGEAE